VWTTGDMPRSVGIGYGASLRRASKMREKFLAIDPSPAELAKPFDKYQFSYHFDPVTQTDPRKLAATRPGRVAREIHNRVLAYQGSAGYLASRQDEKHVPIPRSTLGTYSTQISPPYRTAFWSPDGELGYLRARPQLPVAASVQPSTLPARRSRPGLLRQLQHRVRLLGRQRGSDTGRDVFW
jgi:hypothetical protein